MCLSEKEEKRVLKLENEKHSLKSVKLWIHEGISSISVYIGVVKTRISQ